MKHKILMFHGKEGSPHGRKASYLRKNPHFDVHVPEYPSNRGPVREVFGECYEIAKRELLASNPELLIGSSFGGGILLKLVKEGIWRGPCIFLAQAGVHYKISDSLPEYLPCVLIHGAADNVIDVRDSVLLASTSKRAKIVILPNDGHQLESLLGGLLDLSIEYLLQQN